MANPAQDSITVQVGGVAYTLRLDINAICDLEDQLSQSEGGRFTFAQLLARVDAGDMRSTRLVFLAALKSHHPDATIETAGLVVTELFRSGMAGATMAEFTKTTAPTPEDAKALGLKPARPLKARTRSGGTGTRSTGSHVGRESRAPSSAD